MFHRHEPPTEPADPVQDAVLPGESDPDPLVQGAVERLLDQLRTLDAVDQWGRPVNLRQIARIALGDLTSSRVRDAVTAERMAKALSTSPEGTDRSEDWRRLRDEAGALPEA